MKAKKLMTLCLVGILSVATLSTTVLANSTYEADQETTVKYIPNGGGPSGPIDPDNPDTDPNNWMVYYEKTVNLTQGNINTTDFDTTGNNGKSFTFSVKRQVAGTIVSGTNPDGMNVSEGNVGATGITVTAVATDESNHWNTTGEYIEMSSNTASEIPQMKLRTSGGTIVGSSSDTIATMTHTAPTDTTSAAITGGITSIINDGTKFSVNLKYTFTRNA